MVLATAVFALTFALQLDGYRSDEVTTGAWIAGLGALALLAGAATSAGHSSSCTASACSDGRTRRFARR